MTSRYEARSNLPVETQLQLIHHDLDDMDANMTSIVHKIDQLDEKLDHKLDRLMYVFIGGTVSLIVALVAALATAITI